MVLAADWIGLGAFNLFRGRPNRVGQKRRVVHSGVHKVVAKYRQEARGQESGVNPDCSEIHDENGVCEDQFLNPVASYASSTAARKLCGRGCRAALVGLLSGLEIGVHFGEGRGNMGTLAHT